MEKLVQDLKSTIRLVLRKPGFAAVIVVTLALGIGANTAIFSVVYGVLLRPLPIKDPDRVVRLNETYLPSGWGTASAANFLDWRERNTVFDHLSAYQFQSFNLENTDSPVRVAGASVTADYFDTMGVQAEMGRGFAPGEDADGKNHVAVIGDRTWRSQFAG
ncbi:MAG TPA: ABC transporter permease, partial [Blastocatellia bacterium]|nr:ABC transporter permease [Blastocatellia bacterium]